MDLLAYDDVGDGPAVVLLHSGMADRRMWRELVAPLSDSYRVVSPDLRGFGTSPLPPGETADADDVAALLDYLQIREAAVVGSSLGGRVALELATLHPARVLSLALLCPATRVIERTRDADDFAGREARLLEAGDLEGAVSLNVDTFLGPEASHETRAQVVRMQRNAMQVQLAAETAVPAPRRREVALILTEIDVPTLVVSGDLDMDHFQTVARLLADEVPRAELVSFPWAAHLPSLERPDAVTSLLLRFLRTGP